MYYYVKEFFIDYNIKFLNLIEYLKEVRCKVYFMFFLILQYMYMFFKFSFNDVMKLFYLVIIMIFCFIVDVEYLYVRFFGNFVLNLWDCGG